MAQFNPFKPHDWKKQGEKVKHGLEHAAHDVGHELKDAAEDTGAAFSDFGKEVEKGWKSDIEKPFKVEIINGTKREVIAPSKEFFEEVEQEFDPARLKKAAAEKAAKYIDEKAQQAVAKLIKEGLKKALAVLEIAVPSSMDTQLGPFIIGIDDIKDRIETLRKWVDDPPLGRDRILEMIQEFAPSYVCVSISAEVAFLVVSSDSLSVGFELTFELQDFIDHYPAIMDEFHI